MEEGESRELGENIVKGLVRDDEGLPYHLFGTANFHREERAPAQKGKEGREELLGCCVCKAVLAI
jgi:hypothetical protein